MTRAARFKHITALARRKQSVQHRNPRNTCLSPGRDEALDRQYPAKDHVMDHDNQEVDDRKLSGDYGYDLVHEIKTGGAGAAARTRHAQHDLNRRATGETGSDGDYGYDEAHDL
jgi:hypothetical protein